MKILLAVDTSKFARKVVEYTGRLAKKSDARLTLFHAVVVPTGVNVGVDPGAFLNAGNRLLARHRSHLEKLGVKAFTHVDTTYGNPADRIMEHAKKGGFDLIALGAMGESEIKDLLLGSVAHTVTRHAVCPVLIVR